MNVKNIEDDFRVVAFFTSSVLRSESKDPSNYAVNNPNKMIGMLLGAKAGDVIRYFKTDGKRGGGVSLNAQEISICKYKEMLMSTVKDALEIMGRGSSERIEAGDVWYNIETKGEKPLNQCCSTRRESY
jgi:hypothetical protein